MLLLRLLTASLVALCARMSADALTRSEREQGDEMSEVVEAAAGVAPPIPATASDPTAAAAADRMNASMGRPLPTQATVEAGSTPAEQEETLLLRIELPEAAVAGMIIRFTLPDGRLARATVPDLSQVAGWPEERILCVCVPKPPPPPPGSAAPHSPVRLHPTVILQGVLETVQGTAAEASAMAAVSAVSFSPSQAKAERKRKAPLPPLNPELQGAAAAAGAVLGSQL